MAADTGKPVRVLHIVGGLDRGGVETWLVNVLRHIDRKRYSMDFVVHTTKACAYDDEVRALGARIFPCPYTHRPLKYASELRRILEEHGPYDVVHSHVHHFSGLVLRLAHHFGARMRIAHSHSDTRSVEVASGLLRRGYLRLMKWWIRQHATIRIAVSRLAAEDLYGMNWEADPFARILHCGIDLDQFQEPLYDDSLRGELGLKSDVTVIGHVGRFAEAKNHTFLIDIMAELIELDPNTHLVLVGDGPLRHRIQQRVADLELSSNVHFVGLRSDVAKVMLSTFDVFVLPSLHEGLPVVAVEAQAAGLPCVLSDTVAPEATVVPALVTRLSLNMSSRDWANTVLDSVRTPTGVQRSEALQRVQNSPFNIVANVAALSALYSQHATPSLRS